MQGPGRVRAGRLARGLAAAALAAAGALLAAGCASPATPSPYPSVFNVLPRHEDTPMAPDEVKQALDNLAADRSHLCAQTAAPGPDSKANCGEAGGATPAPGATGKP